MSDDDLIRRGDVLALQDRFMGVVHVEKIAALPAVTPGAMDRKRGPDVAGPWPQAPKGARVTPPYYEMHPFSVSYVFGRGWGLFKQLPASGASAKVSDHASAEDALRAMVSASAALAAMEGKL
jgi:hypothetical protein